MTLKQTMYLQQIPVRNSLQCSHMRPSTWPL